MALKGLLLKGKLERAKEELLKLREKDADFEKREAELTAAIGEITSETSEEDRTEIEKQVEDFGEKKKAHEDEKKNLEGEIERIEGEIEDEEKRSAEALKNKQKRDDKKGEKRTMNTRTKFYGMTVAERDEFFARDDVKGFLERTREIGKEKRAVSGADLLIPTVMLDLLKENILLYSKLYKYLNVKNVSGKARQNIMGTIPEGVWTEMCATLNELSLTFSNAEVDGYMVGGYMAICDAVLEDSDINLASEILSALGQAIGFALDKAVLYGTGTKMPLGIVTRLTQTSAPADYPATARPWVNLSDSNVLVISGKTDVALFKELVKATGAAKGKYSRGAKFWTMNDATYASLVSNALSINASGAIVAGVEKTMPVIGGAIEILDFIPDNVIIGGYGDLYLLAERSGTTLKQSEHVRFLQNQTVFKGTARYDGLPVIAEGFIAIGIGDAKPAAGAVTFTEDKANTSAE